MSVKKIHLFPSEESYVANSGSVEADDLALVPLNLSFNNLSDKPKAYVTETWHSGASWYRKYSDGFIIQGGEVVSPNPSVNDYFNVTITLHKPMSNGNYCVFLTSNDTHGDSRHFVSSATNKKVSSMEIKQIFATNANGSWVVCGY